MELRKMNWKANLQFQARFPLQNGNESEGIIYYLGTGINFPSFKAKTRGEKAV
jgi:hypothetical protein